MHLIIIHRNKDVPVNDGSYCLQVGRTSRLISDTIFEALKGPRCFQRPGGSAVAIPQECKKFPLTRFAGITGYDGSLTIPLTASIKNFWLVISNGRFVTQAQYRRMQNILNKIKVDLVAVNIDPALMSYAEKLCITSRGNVAGFRRLYSESMLPASLPTDWPVHLFIRSIALEKILDNRRLPLSFHEFLDRCRRQSLSCISLKFPGRIIDLETEDGLLRLLTDRMNLYPKDFNYTSDNNKGTCRIARTARIFGPVVFGNNVHLGDNVLIVGPAILGDNVRVTASAVIKTSIISPGLELPKGCFVQNRILLKSDSPSRFFSVSHKTGINPYGITGSPFVCNSRTKHNFRTWPLFSYPGSVKRFADIIACLFALTLFAPAFLLIALVVKFRSPGPVLFKHKRQGLHGKEFNCLKFRTMIIGADSIQDKLRYKNQADGPQFKVENDPRVTALGRFLRDTFIDEIPQFINVLLGQMSVIGPRPSPEEENSLCPFWRDARLSVRPGITGLWQICRTRRPGHDFQEWIYYDVKYVKKLSLLLDLWICCQTAKKLITNFLDRL
ncbi:MAG: sugar transferase [Planctomycetota bacterium]|jgi:lipopolysaccharide/colanic/teichoic acid biosynthesis glycosyltransferase